MSIGPTVAEEGPEPLEESPEPSEERPKSPAEILHEMDSAFREMDVNCDGTLDHAEVQAAFERSGTSMFSDDTLQPILEDLLQMHGGRVNFDQFKDIAWKAFSSSSSSTASASWN